MLLEISVSKLKFRILTNSQNCCFGLKMFLCCFFYLLAKTILLYPKCGILNTKLNFKVLKKELCGFKQFPKKIVYARKCNFKDFDTISILQFYYRNTYRFGLPYDVAAIDCKKKKKK